MRLYTSSTRRSRVGLIRVRANRSPWRTTDPLTVGLATPFFTWTGRAAVGTDSAATLGTGLDRDATRVGLTVARATAAENDSCASPAPATEALASDVL